MFQELLDRGILVPVFPGQKRVKKMFVESDLTQVIERLRGK
jgi:hypothetical protein